LSRGIEDFNGHGKKMSKESREDLSCFMDGEISMETSRFLVRRLGADGELRATWARYHLVRDCLRAQEGDLMAVNLCGRVQQALASEAHQPASAEFSSSPSTSSWKTSAWLKPVTGLAVAASVALMAIITVGPGQISPGTATGDLAGTPQAESFVSPKGALTLGPVTQQVSVLGGVGDSNQRMNSYLLRHYQATDSAGGKGFVTFVPMVVTQASAKAEERDPNKDVGDSSGEVQTFRDRVNESSQ